MHWSEFVTVTYKVQRLTYMAAYTTFDDIHYYRDMLLYYHDSGKIWLSPSPSMYAYLLTYILYIARNFCLVAHDADHNLIRTYCNFTQVSVWP